MISSEQVADFEKQRQSLVMMTTYIASAIQEKRRVRMLSHTAL
jgi:RNA polymerase I-specific transcription initiation factor RRN3